MDASINLVKIREGIWLLEDTHNGTAYVVAGVVLGAVGIYAPVFEFAGAGATVPLTGFGFLISRGVREAVAAEGWIGALKGPLTAASGGIGAALTAGLLVSLLFDSRAKG